MNLIDSHCHLDFHRFENDRHEVIARAADAGVTHMVVPAVDQDNLDTVLALAAANPAVYAAVGIHPTSTAGWQPEWIDLIRAKAAAPKVVAIGEIGLDFYWDKSPPEVQRQALEAQLVLAVELDLPVILHNREATAAMIQQLSGSPAANRDRAGVLHSFSAGWEDARRFLEMGFYIGITGPITFKKADELREVAANVPVVTNSDNKAAGNRRIIVSSPGFDWFCPSAVRWLRAPHRSSCHAAFLWPGARLHRPYSRLPPA